MNLAQGASTAGSQNRTFVAKTRLIARLPPNSPHGFTTNYALACFARPDNPETAP
jgi:hypothetical protein